MSQFTATSSAAALDWRRVAPAKAGFVDDLEARLDQAIADQRVWNLHSVLAVRHGRLVLERYFEGQDNARGRPLGMVSFKADTLHDLRSVSKSIVGLLYGIALAAGRVPSPEQPLMRWFSRLSRSRRRARSRPLDRASRAVDDDGDRLG
jgi:CubicO group peptidase (beta-lactamase class C family)